MNNSYKHIKWRICCLITSIVCIFSFFTPFFKAKAATSLTLNGKEVEYTFSGAKMSDGKFAVTGTLSVDFKTVDSSVFNRFVVLYSSDQYLKGTLKYTKKGKNYTEEFFLESGKDMTFRSFIDGRINGDTGTKITGFTLSPIITSVANVSITSIVTENDKASIPDIVYVENEKYKVGVKLGWGGGLCYLEDKKDNDKSLTNLLNLHDTGRLVQQSYYGTSIAPYVCASFGGSQWGYNPVQGGDQHGNRSKLVDYEIGSDNIYIKCRPLDWAQNNSMTLSYMENVYTVGTSGLNVQNRFVDFSNYKHDNGGGMKRDQELPAFYTLSYFDKFTFYNGTKPWTNDTLTEKKDLPFWANNKNCYFKLDPKNTETWCAWTSSQTDYGIGLYTPDVTELLAGRNAYNGSKDPNNGATNYVAPLIKTVLKNCAAFEYSYMITTGNVNYIRDVFTSNKDFANQKFDHDIESVNYRDLSFKTILDTNAFSNFKQTDMTYGNNCINLECTGSDPSFYIDYRDSRTKISTGKNKYIVLTYSLPVSNAGSASCELFICTGDETSAKAGKSLVVELIKDGKYHTEIIDMTKHTDIWPDDTTALSRIRFDYIAKAIAGDKMSISGIVLSSSSESAIEAARKADPIAEDIRLNGQKIKTDTPATASSVNTAVSSGTSSATVTSTAKSTASASADKTSVPGEESPAGESSISKKSISAETHEGEKTDGNTDNEDEEDINPPSRSNSNTIIFIVISVGGLLLISGIVIPILIKCRKRRE